MIRTEIPAAIGAAVLAVLGSATTASGAFIASTVPLNFNATNIADTSFIWFNSVLNPPSLPAGSSPFTVYLRNASLHIVDGATVIDVPVPDADITYSTSVTTASASFASEKWTILAPFAGAPNVFMGGVTVDPPAGTNLGGADVNWKADFATNYTGSPQVKIQWQAAAAVYTTFSTDESLLGVAAVAVGQEKLGEPTNYSNYVVGGGTGGGGSNYTGSQSPTLSVTLPFDAVPEPAALSLLALSGLTMLGRRQRRAA